MRPFLIVVVILAASCLMSPDPAFAHHGGAMFDFRHPVSVRGIATSYQFENPHVLIYIDVRDDKGAVRKWTVETRGGVRLLSKVGWTKDTIKPGDQLTFVGYPNKNGSPSMRLQKIVMPNGTELSPGS